MNAVKFNQKYIDQKIKWILSKEVETWFVSEIISILLNYNDDGSRNISGSILPGTGIPTYLVLPTIQYQIKDQISILARQQQLKHDCDWTIKNPHDRTEDGFDLVIGINNFTRYLWLVLTLSDTKTAQTFDSDCPVTFKRWLKKQRSTT